MAPALEVADVFRRHGEAFRQARAGHLGRVERRVMGAITACRTAALGGHVEQCDDCAATRIAYNSCRNRHCPKCQVLVLSLLFRRLFLQTLQDAFDAGKRRFFGKLAGMAEPTAFATGLDQLRRIEWVVYAKPPFGGPEQVLAYLGRYTHRVAIANSRLLSLADGKVRFTWKDYRQGGITKVMTLDADEFIRRFLLHALPDGFHRIRHYGFLANGDRADNVALCQRLLDGRDTGACEPADNRSKGDRPLTTDFAICPDCGGTMRQIAAVPRSCNPQPFSCDTS